MANFATVMGGCTSNCGGGNVLTKDVPVTGISEAAGASTIYTFVVPSGASNLTFKTSGGTGDADIYTQLGVAPTTSSYLAKSDGATTTETITIAAPTPGTYYLMVKGYAASSGISLVASYSTGGTTCVPSSTVLCNGSSVTGISVSAGGNRMFTMVVPAGRPSVTFKTTGGTGDADLYVKLGSAPTTSSYTGKSDGSTATETVTLTNPAAGTYYVMVYGYTAASGITLTGSN